MVKLMLVILTLIFINGCGDKQMKLTPKVNDKNSTVTITTESNRNTVHEVTIVNDYIPPHIANSTIEVVPH